MTKRPTLLILAAGMATRYGSLKQLDRFGPCGETIIDYSIYDAIKAGFGKVVFVIRKCIEEEFKAVMLDKFANKIAVDYVTQELDILPEGFSVPENRKKPWGTAHAVWVAAPKIQEPFAVINADDFYGYESFRLIADFLQNQVTESAFTLVAYPLANTLSEHGAVSRGVCETDKAGNLKSVTEQTHIVRTAKGIIAQTPDKNEIEFSGNETVSMNLMGFLPTVFPYFESCLKEFLQYKSPEGLKTEFYLPEVVNKLVRTEKARVKLLTTSEKWFGVTFPEDKAVAVQNLQDLVNKGVYSENLWGNPILKEKKYDRQY